MGKKREQEKNNTMKAVRFLKVQIISAVIGTLVYSFCPGLYRPVWEEGTIASVFLFCLFVFVGYVVGIVFSIYNKRNAASVFRNTVIPLGVYTIITYYGDYKRAIVALIVTWGIISAFLVSECTLVRRNNEKEDCNLRLNKGCVGTWIWTVAGLALLALILVFAHDGIMEWLRCWQSELNCATKISMLL